MSNAQSPNGNEKGLIEDLSWFDKSLAELLEPDEKVLVRLEGVDISGLVCTDRRVIVFHTGHFTWFLGNVRSFYAPYDRITGVSVTPSLRIQPLLGGGLVFEVVTLEMGAGATVAGSMFEFAAEPNRIGFPKAKGEILNKVVGLIQERIASAPGVDAVHLNPTAEQPASDSPMKMLEQLADLKAKGILSEEEFQDQKRKVLERL